MDVLRKELCALSFGKMHTKLKKYQKNILSVFIHQDGKKCSHYFNLSIL